MPPRTRAPRSRAPPTTSHHSPEVQARAATPSTPEGRQGHAVWIVFWAQAARDDYDHNNYRDDQFDLSDGLASIALATTAIAALVETWWLLFFGWGAGSLSILFMVAGYGRTPRAIAPAYEI